MAASSDPLAHIIFVAATGESASFAPSRVHCALPRLQSSLSLARPEGSNAIV